MDRIESEVINADDDSESSDDDDILAAFVVVVEDVRRDVKLWRRRWDSSYLVDLAIREGSFVSEYRVDPSGFDILTRLLQNSLMKDQVQAKRSLSGTASTPITVDSRIGAALIMLAGGRQIEVMRTHGLPQATVYSNLHEVVAAINAHPALAIHCLNDSDSLASRAKSFKALGTQKLFHYCTGALDGLAIRIQAPSKKETANQTRFFNGNKKFFALNMQGVCDAQRRFLAVSCKHVGSTNDIDAFMDSDLLRLNNVQRYPYHWNADAAYCASESLMVPFSGVNLNIVCPAKEWFNYWHSQLRITIECTFGIFIQRWGIFWTDLRFSISNVVAIVHACVRLHNFCINRNLPVIACAHRTPPAHAEVDSDGILLNEEWRVTGSQEERIRGGNTLRHELLNKVSQEECFRHDRNIARKNNN